MPSIVVVPCFNEAARLDVQAFRTFLDRDHHLLFVDDGSKDSTRDVLASFVRSAGAGATTMLLAQNCGKAEAVRLGLLQALRSQPDRVGFLDADLSTPVVEAQRLLAILAANPALDVVTGARVARAGARIERRSSRHYLGRVFATAAANILRFPYYDTQCGAKFFRRTAALERALTKPFLSRWAFDVELLGRLMIGDGQSAPVPSDRFHEEPLKIWRDVAGSKVTTAHMVAVTFDLARIERDLQRRRAIHS